MRFIFYNTNISGLLFFKKLSYTLLLRPSLGHLLLLRPSLSQSTLLWTCLSQLPTQPEPPSGTTSQVGSFIKVELQGRNRKVPFYGKILHIDSESKDLKVLYLKQRPDSGMSVWADEAWLPAHHPVTCVSPPTLAPGRGVAFIF